MDNWLKEFEKLMLDNVILKVQNSSKQEPEMEIWWQIVQEITKEHIQKS